MRARLQSWTKSTTRFHAAACSGRYMPVQPKLMRASGETQVISVRINPAPPSARAPRWTRWKSLGIPSSALYMSMGATTMRLRTVMPRSAKGVNMGGTGRTPVFDSVFDSALDSVCARPANQRSTPSR